MQMWRIFLLSTLPAVCWAELGPDMISPKMADHQAGIICAPQTAGTAPAPGTVAGTTHLIDVNPAFVSTKRRVPAVIGIGFGVKSRAVDPNGLAGVVMTITHPAMGSAAITTQTFESRITGTDDPSLTFYQFDFDYELQTGIWQMQAAQGAEVLYRTTFEVVDPVLVPELATVCGFTDLLSHATPNSDHQPALKPA